MNALAKIYRTHNAKLEIKALLGVGAFDLNRALEIDAEFLHETAHEHDESVASVALVASSALDMQRLNDWISYLLQTQGTDIFRMKGIVNIAGEDN
jgi:G3E family GTPase